MMKKLSALLLIYATLLTGFLALTGILSSSNTNALLFQLFIVPVALYFFVSFLRMLKSKQLDLDFTNNKKRLVFFGFLFVLFMALGINNIQKERKAQPTTKDRYSDSPLILNKENIQEKTVEEDK